MNIKIDWNDDLPLEKILNMYTIHFQKNVHINDT